MLIVIAARIFFLVRTGITSGPNVVFGRLGDSSDATRFERRCGPRVASKVEICFFLF
jgi:hypothetical protein